MVSLARLQGIRLCLNQRSTGSYGGRALGGATVRSNCSFGDNNGDRRFMQSPAKDFLGVPALFQAVSKDDFPDGFINKPWHVRA